MRLDATKYLSTFCLEFQAAPYTNAATNNTWGAPINPLLKLNGGVAPPIVWYWTNLGATYDPTLSSGVTGITYSVSSNSNSPCGYLLLAQEPNPNTPIARAANLGAIVDNTISFPAETGANKLWADKYAYKKLRKNDDLRVLGSADDYQYENYVLNNNATCTGKLDQLTDYLDSASTNTCEQMNNSITTNIPANIARKQVNDIYISSWYKGIAYFETADSLYLCDIAASDPLLFGDAVYSAQVMMNECVNTTPSTERSHKQNTETKELIVESKKATIIPNPNNGIMYTNILLDKNEIGELTIYDLAGKQLSSYSLTEGRNDFEIDKSSLNAGIYLYRISINGKISETKKLIIVK